MSSFHRALLVLKTHPPKYNLNRVTKRFNSDKKKAEEPVKGISYKNLTIGVPREQFQNEKRVSVSPAVAQTLVKKGFKVYIEENAGALAKFNNDQYEKAGAKITSLNEVYDGSDILLKVRAPSINVRL